MADAAADAKVLKQVGEAKKAFTRLEAEIAKTVKGVKKGEFDEAKSRAAAKKVRAAMKKFTPLSKVSGSPAYAALSAEAQAGADWMQGLMADLLAQMSMLERVKKISKLPPEKPAWLKTVKIMHKEAKAEMGGLPPGVGTLVKQIEKGVQNDAPGIAILPMSILLITILYVIRKGWDNLR